MKKLLSFGVVTFVIGLLVSLGLFTTTANAESEGCYNYTVSNDEATITSCNTKISGDIVLPSQLGGYPVTAIDSYAFSNYTAITSVIIPDSVKAIGGRAFYSCSGLTDVTLPNSITSINTDTFYYCTSLKDITIPDSVKTIASGAFRNCTSLKNIVIPDSVTNIERGAFNGCTPESITLPFIGKSEDEAEYTFFSYIFGSSSYSDTRYIVSSLKTVVITKTATIGENAFYKWSKLTSITIPDSVTTIGEDAFYGCSSLKSIIIPDSVTNLGMSAFENCSNLISASIGNGITTISPYAFRGCYNLSDLSIGNNVTSIGSAAFKGCSALVSVEIPYGVTTIGSDAFDSCSSLKNVNIPNSVVTIEFDAFDACKALRNIVIPDSVTSIGNGVFDGCLLESITLPFIGKSEDETEYTFFSYIFGSSSYSDTRYICSTLKSVVITKASTISKYAFYRWSKLTSITIPKSVTSVGSSAFYGCNSLQNVYYQGSESDKEALSVTSSNSSLLNASWHYNSCLGSADHTYIADCVAQCSICDHTREVSDDAIHTYDRFDTVYCIYCGVSRDMTNIVGGFCGEDITWELNTETGTLKLVGSGATYNYVNIGDVNPFVEHRANINTIHIGDGITHLGNRLFRGLSQTTSVTFGKDITTMGYEVFYGCSKLSEVNLNEGLTIIGALTFYNCTKLEEIVIPSTVTNLQNRAFKSSGLTFVNVPDTVKTMGYEVFMDCTNLESVDFTKGCSMLNPRTFENCTALKTFNFTNNMCRIRSCAFYGCTALESITFEDADNMWGSSNGSEAKIASNAFEGCNSSLQLIADKGTHVETYASKFGFTFMAK